MRIVIPGGSGQVGTILSRYFHRHEVTILGRRHPASTWIDTLEGADVCINLAGRSVNCRYNAKNRREILDSRVRTTQTLNAIIAALDRPPAVWLNASTATIYRHALDRPMDEATGELGRGFSVDVATSWERAFFETATPRTRKVALRSAMTFSPDPGGVFSVLLGLVRAGLGGTQAAGTQYVSWIHETDFPRAVEFLIAREDLSGVVNLASPNPLPNCEFLRILREVWGAPLALPLPRWALEFGAFLMRTESELVLKSRRVVPGRLLAAGFCFDYPDWPGAARDLVARIRRPA